MRTVWLLGLLALVGCKKGDDPVASPLWDVPESERWVNPSLDFPAMVIRTEHNVPHIYAATRKDLARVQGFTLARDRFFSMDLASRLATGELSALLGDLALESDLESRGIGSAYVTDNLLATSTEEELEYIDAFAEGVNDYIDAVQAEKVPPPDETLVFAAILAKEPLEAMERWDRRRVAGLGGIVYYNLGYETYEISRTRDYQALDGLYAGAPLEQLRQDGVYDDIWNRVDPPMGMVSAPNWGRRSAGAPPPRVRRGQAGPQVPLAVLDRLDERMKKVQTRMGRDPEKGWGSNAWAVSGDSSADGRSLMAGDGHLSLSIPSLLYQLGLDTQELGGGDTHLMGMSMIGMPVIGAGTNGDIAWSSTQVFGDITDWYAEEIQLDSQGRPSKTMFKGNWKPLDEVKEEIKVANVDFLDSRGRTEKWSRWVTFDGRWLADIEGRAASIDEKTGNGEALVNMQGDWIVPEDLDGDGKITGVSFDFTGLDDGNLLNLWDRLGHAKTVDEANETLRDAVALSQNMIVSDSNGSVLYTGYQAVPCRNYLPRDKDGVWKDGADPRYLLDGTTYGGFTVPIVEGHTVTGHKDPYKCVIRQEDYPHAIDPAQGFVESGNNDPGGYTLDNNLYNDRNWIGGPWEDDYRSLRIEDRLKAAIKGGKADISEMSDIQNEHWSPLGWQFSPVLLEAIDAGRQAAAGSPAAGSSEERMAALFTANKDRFEEVESRIEDWEKSGFYAKSGVDTFYDPVKSGDKDAAVATTIFNAWIGDFMRQTFDDEGIPGRAWFPTGTTGRTRTMSRMIESRGKNDAKLSSYNPATKESAFFDIKDTPEIETSDEVALIALEASLDFLESDPTEPGEGGFGTKNMNDWLWGLRHRTKFESLLADFIGDDEDFAFLSDMFSITTETLPLANGMSPTDPRRDLKWFPRHSDSVNVDTGKAGLSGRSWDQSSGAVFRLVVALGGDEPEAVNILPGGQSGLVDSLHFADQAELWLANEVRPMPITVDQVREAGLSRETFMPPGLPYVP